jgi:transcriptional regulator
MLTEKEIEVLKLKKSGLSQLEIAKKLRISQPAVSNFYNNSLWKIKDAKETLMLSQDFKLDVKLKNSGIKNRKKEVKK